MEHSTATGERAETNRREKPLEFESQIVLGLGKGQILPAWLSSWLRRVFRRHNTPAR